MRLGTQMKYFRWTNYSSGTNESSNCTHVYTSQIFTTALHGNYTEDQCGNGEMLGALGANIVRWLDRVNKNGSHEGSEPFVQPQRCHRLHRNQVIKLLLSDLVTYIVDLPSNDYLLFGFVEQVQLGSIKSFFFKLTSLNNLLYKLHFYLGVLQKAKLKLFRDYF